MFFATSIIAVILRGILSLFLDVSIFFSVNWVFMFLYSLTWSICNANKYILYTQKVHKLNTEKSVNNINQY